MKANTSPGNKLTSKPYGRQAKGKTIKSISLDADVAARAEEKAKLLGVSFSKYLNDFLDSEHPPAGK